MDKANKKITIFDLLRNNDLVATSVTIVGMLIIVSIYLW